MSEPIEAIISEALRDVYDPCCKDKGISVVDMGLLHHAELDGGVARVELLLTSGWCPFASRVLTDVESVLRSLPGVAEAYVEIVWSEAWSPDRLSDSARSKLRFLCPTRPPSPTPRRTSHNIDRHQEEEHHDR